MFGALAIVSWFLNPRIPHSKPLCSRVFYYGLFYLGFYYGLVFVRSWQECGVLCAAEPTCFFWSYVLPPNQGDSGFCILQPDCDLCLDGEVGFAISGKKGCMEWTQKLWNILHQSSVLSESFRLKRMNSGSHLENWKGPLAGHCCALYAIVDVFLSCSGTYGLSTFTPQHKSRFWQICNWKAHSPNVIFEVCKQKRSQKSFHLTALEVTRSVHNIFQLLAAVTDKQTSKQSNWLVQSTGKPHPILL